MEIRSTNNIISKLVRSILCLLLVLCMPDIRLNAQERLMLYKVHDGKMYIELSNNINAYLLDSFIAKHNLFDLDLKALVFNNSTDNLKKRGWKTEKSNAGTIIITKPFSAFDKINNAADKIVFTAKNSGSYSALFPVVSSNVKFGCNKFRNKNSFAVNDSIVTFFLRNNSKAKQVMLAGSFNNWNPKSLAMIKTDSGWIANVKMIPGKYWYKFIIDGNWTVDLDNLINENDYEGNNNSVYYKTNQLFVLKGYSNAKKVFVAGNFNNWQLKQLQMFKTSEGWQLPIYFANGTFTYRFVIDGQWFTDPLNANKYPNEFNDFNSVLKIGKTYNFTINGFTNATKVILTGSFNNWAKYELLMNKTATGWALPYTLGPGNYEYRYIIDGKETIETTFHPVVKGKDGKNNNYLVIEPNYTFRLKGFASANNVYLSGDFVNWSPQTLQMHKDGNDWVFRVHLSPGKHIYKFVVDGKWIKDPNNTLWEQNEYSTGNSIVWIEE